MKKNRITSLLCFCLCVNFVVAQTPQERIEIQKYYLENVTDPIPFDEAKYSLKAYQEALARAESLGVATKLTLEDGREAEFVGFEGDQPLYYAVHNAGSAVTSRANLVHPGGSMGLNLTGLGMIIGIWDQNHPRMTHNDFDTRLMIADGASATVSNHSTHVTGTVLSSGASNANGRGIAYQAEGWINDWVNDYAEMNALASFGLVLSNHSYGWVANQLQTWQFGAYVSASNAVDNICFNNPKYQPVFSAGNDRDNYLNINPSKGGADLLTGDKVSKNGLLVGAVGAVQNYQGPQNVNMSGFSNYGPTDDFRIKPDIVTKGVTVFSTTNESDTGYGNLSGTSMSAPGVTGSLGLIQQFYGAPYMNAATLRGLVIHTADEAGPAAGPDHMFGWGLLNVAKSIQVLIDEGDSSLVFENTLNNTQEYVFDVLANELEDLVVTLAWTDRPGAPVPNGTLDSSVPKLVNDLDVRVIKQGQTYFPWKLNKNFSNLYALQGDNDVDNVEKIEVSNPSGVYQVRVSHKGSLTGGNQRYSLIVSGIDVEGLSVNKQDSADFVVWKDRDKNISFYNRDLTDGVYAVDLYDINGKLVKQVSFESAVSEGLIDCQDLSSGIYMLKFKTDSGFFVRKIAI